MFTLFIVVQTLRVRTGAHEKNTDKITSYQTRIDRWFRFSSSIALLSPANVLFWKSIGYGVPEFRTRLLSDNKFKTYWHRSMKRRRENLSCLFLFTGVRARFEMLLEYIKLNIPIYITALFLIIFSHFIMDRINKKNCKKRFKNKKIINDRLFLP